MLLHNAAHRYRYTLVRTFDTLQLGQYPTGGVFEFDKKTSELSYPVKNVGHEPGVSAFAFYTSYFDQNSRVQ
jgi:hypothetical protein